MCCQERSSPRFEAGNTGHERRRHLKTNWTLLRKSATRAAAIHAISVTQPSARATMKISMESSLADQSSQAMFSRPVELSWVSVSEDWKRRRALKTDSSWWVSVLFEGRARKTLWDSNLKCAECDELNYNFECSVPPIPIEMGYPTNKTNRFCGLSVF